MSGRRQYAIPAMRGLWHGGDWNPDQWLDRPEIIDEDFRLFPLAGVNVVSIGIFSWTRLEPEDGRYDFAWLDEIMDRLDRAGVKAALATPSGSKPAWMSHKYPEILRCASDRTRDLHGGRHNHCYTSPVYRRKALEINTRLAERYAKHPALALWHVSNEYGGECHCPLCQAAFRNWLRDRYGSLEALNRAWWSDFWSHRYGDWEELESPSPRGEESLMGLSLDWKRFVNHQSLDFFLAESAVLRRLAPGIPVAVNMMGTYPGLDYWNWAPHVDVVGWDNYPRWHANAGNANLGGGANGEADEASRTAFVHDLTRSLGGGRPWLLIESSPSQVNWQPVNRLKAPGMHLLSSMQAVAHGSDSVMYFQWRKGRGGAEKFHGAVVGHDGREDARTFGEVAEVGRKLRELEDVAGSTVEAEVAVVYDWENRWAIDGFMGFGKEERDYERACVEIHRAFWKRSIACDVPDQGADFGRYKIVLAPWLHLVKKGTAERLESFVASGGSLILSFFSGMVDESDLCFEGGFPGPLRRLAGLWVEELDPLWKGQRNRSIPVSGKTAGLSGEYGIDSFCELVRVEGAEVLATYGDDWYAGRPVLTRNSFGKGLVYYLAARTDQRFLDDLVGHVCREAAVVSVWPEDLPPGVNAQRRSDGTTDYLFLMNFNPQAAAGLPAYGLRVERRARGPSRSVDPFRRSP
ncbi:MAG TPA: beta-galactosidase [Rectinemataceae bacterium]|nr:beta-galactosidase [Rectinemataceae bacterium]